MRLLAVGIVINGASYIPFAYIQGTGRSDLTAKFHLFELALYVPILLIGISWLGLIGVAVAWVLQQPGITSAIIGASRPEQLTDTLTAGETTLDTDELAACDDAWFSLPRPRDPNIALR